MADHAAAWRDHAAGRLSAAGYRSGGARRAVIDVLAEDGCALSAFEVEAKLAATPRKVARASVYRVLEELERLKLVSRVEVGQGVARFEPTHPGGDHHHHFVCEQCGELSPFHDDGLERAVRRVAAGQQFEVGEHDITLRGTCARCQRAAR